MYYISVCKLTSESRWRTCGLYQVTLRESLHHPGEGTRTVLQLGMRERGEREGERGDHDGWTLYSAEQADSTAAVQTLRVKPGEAH